MLMSRQTACAYRHRNVPEAGSRAARPVPSRTRLLRLLPLALALALALASVSPAHSETNTEAIKSEAIELLGRLQRLEQQLLYPAHTQVSVFLSISDDSPVVPQSVSLKIDNRSVSHHVYTQAEINALKSGGIQRLYTGNIPIGKHTLAVSLKQKQADGRTRRHELDYPFNKDEKASYLEIAVGQGGSNRPPIQIGSRN
mgnify:FL=1